MIDPHALNAYLEELLACSTFDDYAPNGMQIEGRSSIRRICTAVTASLEAIEKASKLKADALLVHHGYFWRGESPLITGLKGKRIKRLIESDLSLFAYHLPLDCHTTLGNNACIAKLLGIQSPQSQRINKTADLLWSGSLPHPLPAETFAKQLEESFKREPLHISGAKKPIKTVAWCSGAAQDFIEDAHALGVDAYLSGEISERTYYQAEELGLHYFACGHHATERFGIQALGNHLAEKFKLEHFFMDSSNPV